MAIDEVDEAGSESFPASDPPNWTTMHAGAVKAPTTPPSLDEHLRPMLDWDGYRKQLAVAMSAMGKTSPELLAGYRTMAAAKAAHGALDAKTRELIALAVAVTARCDGCIATHVDAARKRGATKDEITEALGVAVMVNAGAALVYSARTLDAFGELAAVQSLTEVDKERP